MFWRYGFDRNDSPFELALPDHPYVDIATKKALSNSSFKVVKTILANILCFLLEMMILY